MVVFQFSHNSSFLFCDFNTEIQGLTHSLHYMRNRGKDHILLIRTDISISKQEGKCLNVNLVSTASHVTKASFHNFLLFLLMGITFTQNTQVGSSSILNTTLGSATYWSLSDDPLCAVVQPRSLQLLGTPTEPTVSPILVTHFLATAWLKGGKEIKSWACQGKEQSPFMLPCSHIHTPLLLPTPHVLTSISGPFLMATEFNFAFS